jgi:hypothetical protein
MYYPKSQIKTNLYSNGEYILSTNLKPYTGYYYETSNGSFYTGKTPNDTPNISLILPSSPFTPSELKEPSPSTEIIFTPEEFSYSFDSSAHRKLPQFNLTLPTSQDQQNGQFTRYFCKKNNELQYLEINQDTFKKLQRKDPQIAWDLFTPTPIIWQISGNKEQVYASNRASAIAIEQNLKWYGFSQYFQDKFLKYYVES